MSSLEIITTTTPTIPYYTINPSYCWMPDLENQESCINSSNTTTLVPRGVWPGDEAMIQHTRLQE